MRYFFLPYALSAVLVCLAPPLKSAERADIAGTWRLDAASAPAIDSKPVTSGHLTVQYRHKTIEMSESLLFPNGDRSTTRNWKIDSHYHPVLGDESGQVLAKWEGLTLTADHENAGRHENYRLSLSPDGQVLTEMISRADGSRQVFIWRR